RGLRGLHPRDPGARARLCGGGPDPRLQGRLDRAGHRDRGPARHPEPQTETVPRLYREVRPGARFSRSLELLQRAKSSGLLTKSGIMLGLGEEWAEIEETVRAIRAAGTDILTIGQYLRPSADHLPLRRYYTPGEFGRLREFALSLGYRH